VVNGGTGVGTKVREVADCVARAWGVPPNVSFNGAIRSGDPPSLVADISGAARLGFRPSIALQPGIIETVAWFKNAGGARSSA
jgi:UDP-glucose 4-epimerase